MSGQRREIYHGPARGGEGHFAGGAGGGAQLLPRRRGVAWGARLDPFAGTARKAHVRKVQPVGTSAAASIAQLRHPSRHELAADCFIHIIGIAAGSIGGASLVALIAARGNWLQLGALLIYALGMIAMFCCSAAYNLARNSPWRAVLRRCDHAAIFVMIAGTYTPFTLLRLDGIWSWGLTSAVWSIAAIGVVVKLCRRCDLRYASVAPYLLLGWIGIVAVDPLFRSVGWQTLGLIFLGGLLYMVGVVFHVWRRLPFQNAIWHGFVLAAAAVHYAAVVNSLMLGA